MEQIVATATKRSGTAELDNSAVVSGDTGHQELRDKIADDLQAFLAKGGNIEAVASGVRADPPKKPQPKYGGGSI